MSQAFPEIALFAASGPAAREFLATTREPNFLGEIEIIAGARPKNWGKRVGETTLRGFPEYDDMRIASPEEALRNSNARVAVSFLRDDGAKLLEHLIAESRVLITNAGFHRMDPDTALANPYINSGQIDELFEDKNRDSYTWAVANCTSLIGGLPLEPIEERWGIASATIETLQDWSGAGEFRIPKGMKGLVVPIEGDEKLKIETEPERLLSHSLEGRVPLNIKATPKRGPWYRKGHHGLITVKLKQPATAKEIKEAWRDKRAPEALDDIAYGTNSPKRKPIKVSKKPLIHWKESVPSLPTKLLPMRVKTYLRSVEDDGQTVIFEAYGSNLGYGAAGSAAMNLSYAREMGYLS